MSFGVGLGGTCRNPKRKLNIDINVYIQLEYSILYLKERNIYVNLG